MPCLTWSVLLLASCLGIVAAYPISSASDDDTALREGLSRSSALSNDDRANPDQCEPYAPASVFYNRVPKAASTSLKTLASNRSIANGYLHISSRVFNDRGFFEAAEEEENVNRIADIFNKHGKVLYDQHIRYLNFTAYGLEQPAYINMVREPVGRLVSTYYFARTGTHSKRDQIRSLLGEQADWSINECVQRGEECRWFNQRIEHFNLMTRFFCGNAPECRDVSRAAFETAKHNLEHNFLVVGVTERFTESVRVLDEVLPDYFAGAYTLVKGRDAHSRQNVNTKSGEKPTENTQAVLDDLARYDLALYHHAVDLFDRKLHACFPNEYTPAERNNLGAPRRLLRWLDGPRVNHSEVTSYHGASPDVDLIALLEAVQEELEMLDEEALREPVGTDESEGGLIEDEEALREPALPRDLQRSSAVAEDDVQVAARQERLLNLVMRLRP